MNQPLAPVCLHRGDSMVRAHLEDAHRHVAQAVAAIRAAAALDPRTARAASPVHISLVDALEAIGELTPSPGRPKPSDSFSGASCGR